MGTIWIMPYPDGTFLADLAELPGCTARGTTREIAATNVRAAFRDYLSIMERRGVSTEHWHGLDPSTFAVKDVPDDGLMLEDARPLLEHEIRDFLHQYEAGRAELLAVLGTVPEGDMEREPRAGMWSVREALEHIMWTEVVTLSKLEKWPAGELATLQAVHRMVVQRFSAMDATDTKDQLIRGRRFTVRKVMRRLLAHEYEHLGHIKEIIDALR